MVSVRELSKMSVLLNVSYSSSKTSIVDLFLCIAAQSNDEIALVALSILLSSFLNQSFSRSFITVTKRSIAN